ncbi:hypothetical protein Q4563_21000, partial [Gilvimarinus sp. 1_MG-2023]|nr:hypothetical protein [Gilvimarinus sp. 1_MG-2023]
TSLVTLFQWFHPAVPIIATAAMAWFLHRSIRLVLFVVASMLLIINLGYWAEMIETFVLVVTATTICILTGVPVGIYAGHKPKVYN